jgi:hypothetical protein
VKHADGTSWFQSELSQCLADDRHRHGVQNRRPWQQAKAQVHRKFGFIVERDGPANAFGRELLDDAGLVLDYRDGKLNRERFLAWMTPRRQQAHTAATLQRAVDAELGHVSSRCADIFAHAATL